MKKLLIFFINIYQLTLSPDHGFFKIMYPSGFCRFYPSCSQYGKDAILKYGAMKGLRKTIIRIINCNPWSEPKVDILR